VYTPLHGVGGLVLPLLLHSINNRVQILSVTSQLDPNPDFPTLDFPNPEEPGALDLAMKLADNTGRCLVLANDPDADRFAVAEKVK
jgi:phosphoglucomutase